MADYLQALNRDANGIKTSARYDADNATWMHDSAMYVKTAGGIWAPVSPTNPLPSTVTGSIASGVDASSATGKEMQLIGGADAAPTLRSAAADHLGSDARNLNRYSILLESLLAGVNSAGTADRLRVDAQKSLLVGLRSSAGTEPGVFLPINGSGNSAGLEVTARPMRYNGGAWDVEYGNTEVTVLASAPRTATTASASQTNYNGRGVELFINVTAVSGTSPSLQPQIWMYDPASGVAVAYNLGAAITTTGTYRYVVYPAATSGANGNLNDLLSRTWLFNGVISGTTPSFTFSVGASTNL